MTGDNSLSLVYLGVCRRSRVLADFTDMGLYGEDGQVPGTALVRATKELLLQRVLQQHRNPQHRFRAKPLFLQGCQDA